jgi:hypothetical protein
VSGRCPLRIALHTRASQINHGNTIYALPLPEPAVFHNFYLDDGQKIRFRNGERA